MNITKQNNFENVILIGDPHGNWQQIIEHQKKYGIKNSLYIALGDFGIGFSTSDEDESKLWNLSENLQVHKNKIFIMRGNHDKPKYFVKTINFEAGKNTITFLPDYSFVVINKQKWLFIGGALSVDRSLRVEEVNYWKEEKVKMLSNQEIKKLSEVDMLCTHTAPTFCNPGQKLKVGDINGWVTKDMLQELSQERRYLDKIVQQTKPKHLYYGHFHHSDQGSFLDMTWKCVDGSSKYKNSEFVKHPASNVEARLTK